MVEFEDAVDLDDAFASLWDEVELEFEQSLYYPLTGLIHCPLSVYFQKTNVEVTDPPALEHKVRMRYGIELHEMIYRRLDKMGWNCPLGEEKRHYSQYHNLVYVLDKYVRIGDKIYIAEVKTVSPFVYKGGKNYASILKAPKENHLLQIQTEMELLGLPGLLVYHNRDSGMDRILRINRNPNALLEIGNRSTELTNALKEMKPIARVHSLIINRDGLPMDKQQRDKVQYKSSWQCFSGRNGWCPFLTHCWKDDGLDLNWMELKYGNGDEE